MNGYLNLLKPPGMTSHDMVDAVRKQLPGVKAGHGGTLDPGAAGVLPILLGKVTKFSPYMLEFPKVYRAELHLGISTDTADSYGTITGKKVPPVIGQDELKDYISTFTGKIEQIPPMYSAVKKKGRKLYDYARKGEVVERPSRVVSVYNIKVIYYLPPEKLMLEITCSSGTYVRSLCEELGNKIGCGGHMSFLVRIASGSFHLTQAQSLEELAGMIRAEKTRHVLLPPDYPFRGKNKLLLTEEQIRYLFAKKYLILNEPKSEKDLLAPVDGVIQAVYTTEGEFAGLIRCKLSDNQKTLILLKKWKI